MFSNFPARTVVSSFNAVERMLAEVLAVVPYCDEHEEVWSPRLATVLLEACSQLDSLWQQQAVVERQVSKSEQLSITSHFDDFAADVARKLILFFGDPIETICPYEAWAQPNSYQPLEWWQAYNMVKHNRLENRRRATLRLSLEAVAGLFAAILSCQSCWGAIIEAGWVWSNQHRDNALRDDESGSSLVTTVVESALLARPIGWFGETIPSSAAWFISGSDRFLQWFHEQSQQRG